jgi:hypothetical protein
LSEFLEKLPLNRYFTRFAAKFSRRNQDFAASESGLGPGKSPFFKSETARYSNFKQL